MLLGVKRSTNTHCLLLRETGQLPLYSYWLHCVSCSWNSLLTTNNALLSKFSEADLRLAHRKGSWTFEVLSALRKMSGADVHMSAIMSLAVPKSNRPFQRINMLMNDFELLLREQTIRDWRDLNQIHPHDAHVSSRVLKTYYIHFGVPHSKGGL